jgi:hypothetical protein
MRTSLLLKIKPFTKIECNRAHLFNPGLLSLAI